ncbi:tyrosine-type recombinase/integrase [Hyphomonas jannaschiana]|uniref:tyrosine-type recombinase/integrase n=1 Tax=Hyphomonas jannaschiana TaxID=86 RepID=UPI0035C6E444
MKRKITKRLIDSLTAGDSPFVVWDTELRGFGLKVSNSNLKSFILKYRNAHGRQRKPTIGRYGEMTIEEARRLAAQMKVQVSQGQDPSAERKRQRMQIKLNDFADVYFQNASKKQSTKDIEQSYYDSHIRGTLGRLSICSIGQEDVTRWFAGLSDRPGAANRTLSMLSAILNEAERKGVKPIRSNPCFGIRKYPSKPRERFLSHEELERLQDAMDKARQDGSINRNVLDIVTLALLTGARKMEILTMKWSDIRLNEKVVHLEDSKTGPRNLILSEKACTLLRQRKKHQGNNYVFPGRLPGSHVKEIRKDFFALLTAAKITEFRFHDLRHSHASFAIQAGASLAHVAKALGHSQVRTSQRYAHVDDRSARRAVNLVDQIIRM